MENVLTEFVIVSQGTQDNHVISVDVLMDAQTMVIVFPIKFVIVSLDGKVKTVLFLTVL
jgi:hypothetical protein